MFVPRIITAGRLRVQAQRLCIEISCCEQEEKNKAGVASLQQVGGRREHISVHMAKCGNVQQFCWATGFLNHRIELHTPPEAIFFVQTCADFQISRRF